VADFDVDNNAAFFLPFFFSKELSFIKYTQRATTLNLTMYIVSSKLAVFFTLVTMYFSGITISADAVSVIL